MASVPGLARAGAADQLAAVATVIARREGRTAGEVLSTLARRALTTRSAAADRVTWTGVLASRHATDAYLLSLAVAHGGRFVTFDRHVPLAAVPTARPRQLDVID